MKTPIMVISKFTWSNGGRDIQTNNAWENNPYADYALVPEDMMESISATNGFCDIILNDAETEVIGFTAREIPIPVKVEPEPTEEELQWQAITDLEITQMEHDQALTDLEISQMEGQS